MAPWSRMAPLVVADDDAREAAADGLVLPIWHMVLPELVPPPPPPPRVKEEDAEKFTTGDCS